MLNLNWKSLLGTLLLVAPFIETLTGFDFGSMINLLQVAVGAILVIIHRISLGNFNYKSSTILSIVVAVIFSALTAAGIQPSEITPAVSDLITALMGLFAMLGINNAALKKLLQEIKDETVNDKLNKL